MKSLALKENLVSFVISDIFCQTCTENLSNVVVNTTTNVHVTPFNKASRERRNGILKFKRNNLGFILVQKY